MPEFAVGRVELSGVQSDGTITGKPHRQAGFNCLLERQLGDAVWRPILMLGNATGTVSFSDSFTTTNPAVLYRARILE